MVTWNGSVKCTAIVLCKKDNVLVLHQALLQKEILFMLQIRGRKVAFRIFGCGKLQIQVSEQLFSFHLQYSVSVGNLNMKLYQKDYM